MGVSSEYENNIEYITNFPIRKPTIIMTNQRTLNMQEGPLVDDRDKIIAVVQ